MKFKEIINSYFPVVRNERGEVSLRFTIHHVVYFLLLVTLAGSQAVSNYMMSGMEILLAVNWLLECDYRRKLAAAKQSPLLWAFLALMAVHLLWMLGSHNMDYGWYDIFKKLPLFAIPLVVLTSFPLNRKQLEFIFLFFVSTVFVATIIGRVRAATIPDLPYREIIPFISHIRFALNVCLAIVLIVWFVVKRRTESGERSATKIPLVKDWLFWLLLAVTVSLLDFLLVIQSYTAFVVLFVVLFVMVVAYRKRIHSKTLRLTAIVTLSAVVLFFIVLSVVMVRGYYRPVPLMEQPLAEKTVNGNPYQHKQDGLIENGNYVNNYICAKELESEWTKRSAMGLYDTTVNGYTVYPTLLRYLNALGTTKDSVGMCLLGDEDVSAIEKGVANPVLINGSPLRRMYYVMLYEYESYRNFRAVKDFTMLQRFELWRNGWRVFKKHPLLGTGTGDVVDECHKQLIIDASPLMGTKKHVHNQYLTFFITFGVVGFAIIAVVFFYAFKKSRIMQLPVVAAYVCMVLVSFVTEDTLETLAGCVFSVLFLCLFQVYCKTENGERRVQHTPPLCGTPLREGRRTENGKPFKPFKPF